MTDTSMLKPGDVVHVKGIVMGIHREYGGYEIEFRPRHTAPTVPVTLADIAHVEPRPLQVEDRVRTRCEIDGTRRSGYIIAIDDSYAWLRVEPFYRPTVLLSQLERIND